MRSRRAWVLVSFSVLIAAAAAWLLFAASSSGPDQGLPAPPATTGVTATITEPAPTGTGSQTRATSPSSKPQTGQAKITVAEAAGWRLEIYRPTAGATIGKTVTSCYEVTGTSREPVLELEAALAPIAGGDPVGRLRTDIAVGRGSAAFSFDGVRDGRYDLGLRLKVDGRWITGLAVTVEDVRLSAGVSPAECG